MIPAAPRIRPLRLSDVPVANALQQQAFPHDAWSAQSLRDELAAGPARWWVVAESVDLGALDRAGTGPGTFDGESTDLASAALVAGPVVGVAGSAAADDVVDVLSLAVDPAARRRGIGRALLAELVSQARSVGAARVLLEVAADNDPARALYAAAGFVPISRRRGYYAGPRGPGTVDALVLQLRL